VQNEVKQEEVIQKTIHYKHAKHAPLHYLINEKRYLINENIKILKSMKHTTDT